MTAYHMPHCLQQLIVDEYNNEFPRQFEILGFAYSGRIVGVQFYDALHTPYVDLGLSSTIYVAWRGQATPVAAPLSINEETGNAWPTPFTYAADYDDRVAAAIDGIRRLEADYQRALFERSR